MMRKLLAKTMYMTMTFVLIFSMVATNIVIVTADNTNSEYDEIIIDTVEDLKVEANEYEDRVGVLNRGEQSGFRSLLKRINNPEEEDDTPIEGEKLEGLKKDLMDFINKIRRAEADEDAKDAKAEL